MSVSPSVTHPFALAMAGAALKGAALFAVALGVTRLLRGAPAAVRHAVWCAALAAQVALLPAGALLPAWRVAVPEPLRAAAVLPDEAPSRFAAPAPAPRPTEIPAPPPQALEPRTNVTPPTPLPERVRGEVVIYAPRRSTDWTAVAFIVWGAGTLVLLGRIALSALAVARLERRSEIVTEESWLSLLDEARERLGIGRAVRLLRASDLAVPITWGARRPAVVLPDGADAWPSERRRVVLLHELAHVKRLDVVTQGLAQLATSIFWPNPLAWLAARRSRAECERACDDCVLGAGTKPSRYVEDLVDIVRSMGTAPAPAAAALAMARRGEFEGRVLAILDPAVPRATTTPRRAAVASALAAALVLPLAAMRPAEPAPAPQLAVQAPARFDSAAVVASVRQAAESLLTVVAPDSSHRLEAAAVRQASARAAAVVANALTQGRTLRCSPEGGGSNSNWTSKSNGGRTLWRVNWSGEGCSVDLRAEGELTFNRDFTDIESISDGGEFEVSYRVGDELTRLEIRSAGRGRELERRYAVNGTQREYDADAKAWLANLLTELDLQTAFAADARFKQLYRDGGAEAVLAYVPKLRSDYARNRYLMQLLEAAPLDRAAGRRVLRTLAESYDGDYERARALVALAGKSGDLLSDEATQRDYADVLEKLRSDYERTRAMMVLVERGPASAAVADRLLRIESATQSDYELARMLVALAGKGLVNDTMEGAYLRAVGTIESDYERSRVLVALLGRKDASPTSVTDALSLAKPIKSDYEKARVLITIASTYELSTEARGAYREIARGISSDYEYRRAMSALQKEERVAR